MNVTVSGHQLAAGEAFQDYARETMSALDQKYGTRAISSQVTLAPGPHGAGFEVEAVLIVRGQVLKASGRANQARVALDGALGKIEKQLRRHKRRLSNHDGPGHEQKVAMDAGYTVFAPFPEAEDEPPPAPLVIAETSVDVPAATVSDAVIMLDLRNTTALLFKNTKTGTLNMVYRREDGNIGWVEPGGRA